MSGQTSEGKTVLNRNRNETGKASVTLAFLVGTSGNTAVLSENLRKSKKLKNDSESWPDFCLIERCVYVKCDRRQREKV